MNGSLCDDTHMNHFHAGFADELLDIMTKEATSRAEKVKEALKSPEGKRLSRKAGHLAGSGAKGALYGALFHKLVDPEISAGTALRSGVGVTAGGHIGSALGKQVGVRSSKGKLMTGLVGSALGLRLARKKSKAKKSDRELLEMALKKEGAPSVATISGPQNPSRGLGAPPAPNLSQRWGQAKSLAGNISSAAQKGIKGVQQRQQLTQRSQASKSRLQGFMNRKKPQSAPKAGGGLNLQSKEYDFLSKSSPSPTPSRSAPKPQSMGKKIKGTLERREGPSGKMLSKAMRY